ncbi:MAG TPA: molybdopterin-dependent oxidoreductase [Candidatus Dormibacteraeota bacterium]|nr:molybdopterin-dependent oxidoreductase [Candidatus Dormibacteraeota bacterium]
MQRSSFLIGGLAAGGLVAASTPIRALAENAVQLPFANGSRPLVAFPQKRPLMLLTSRPPQLETPLAIFNENVFTPNDAFFVRWHLAGIPTTIDGKAFRIKIHGLVDNPVELSVDELRRNYEAVDIAAVCQCSGNSRGFFEPRVPGGQWGNGAMGNAHWRGARLRDVLHHAGIKAGAVQVRLNGMERPVLPATPDFIKALDMDVATAPDVIIAYEMNGADLPLLNGFPVRLVVPGYFATYWTKMLDDVEVIGEPDENFWMKTAYRIPAVKDGCISPGEKTETKPIGKMPVRSFFTSLSDEEKIPAGQTRVKGIAFDGGSGIRRVDFSTDGGSTWQAAKLSTDYGKYGFRQWDAAFDARAGETYHLAVRATANDGAVQPTTKCWNPGGYLMNIIETVTVTAS